MSKSTCIWVTQIKMKWTNQSGSLNSRNGARSTWAKLGQLQVSFDFPEGHEPIVATTADAISKGCYSDLTDAKGADDTNVLI